MSTRHAAELEVRCPYRRAFDVAVRVVAEDLDDMTLRTADPDSGLIMATTPIGVVSWGEDVEVRVWPSGPGTSAIGVESALKFGLVDWGRNRRNVDRVVAGINVALTVA